VEAPCANDQEFFDKATYILEVANGDQFEETHAVNALEVYLKQRESAWRDLSSAVGKPSTPKVLSTRANSL
jgi:hypothetical protein